MADPTEYYLLKNCLLKRFSEQTTHFLSHYQANGLQAVMDTLPIAKPYPHFKNIIYKFIIKENAWYIVLGPDLGAGEYGKIRKASLQNEDGTVNKEVVLKTSNYNNNLLEDSFIHSVLQCATKQIYDFESPVPKLISIVSFQMQGR